MSLIFLIFFLVNSTSEVYTRELPCSSLEQLTHAQLVEHLRSRDNIIHEEQAYHSLLYNYLKLARVYHPDREELFLSLRGKRYKSARHEATVFAASLNALVNSDSLLF